MIVSVLSKPGREEISYRTFTGLTRQNPGVPFWIYRASSGPIVDFWDHLRAHRGCESLLALEDDIVTARNFFRYAEAWSSPHVTLFFHRNRTTLGRPVRAERLTFTQAVKIPGQVLERLCALERKIGRYPEEGGQDDDLARALLALDEPVVYHPSLVQHVGDVSVGWPGAKLDGRRALDFPGEDFDCLELL